jgi:hypothetical protein
VRFDQFFAFTGGLYCDGLVNRTGVVAGVCRQRLPLSVGPNWVE